MSENVDKNTLIAEVLGVRSWNVATGIIRCLNKGKKVDPFDYTLNDFENLITEKCGGVGIEENLNILKSKFSGSCRNMGKSTVVEYIELIDGQGTYDDVEKRMVEQKCKPIIKKMVKLNQKLMIELLKESPNKENISKLISSLESETNKKYFKRNRLFPEHYYHK